MIDKGEIVKRAVVVCEICENGEFLRLNKNTKLSQCTHCGIIREVGLNVRINNAKPRARILKKLEKNKGRL